MTILTDDLSWAHATCHNRSRFVGALLCSQRLVNIFTLTVPEGFFDVFKATLKAHFTGCELLVSGSVIHEKVMKGLHERLPSRKRSRIHQTGSSENHVQKAQAGTGICDRSLGGR